ncbi:GTP cyclohydrolase II [Hoyosella altamirensis]|uniref:GTP cyclohydrolase II n=2 Tax=Hoyosella altamirensis TaxID=616997 RepID=A0A839RL02_9ACTN|nr:GTP cyclohydrolase II [Hoyosella altamirensis]
MSADASNVLPPAGVDPAGHIRLTSHSGSAKAPLITWGAAAPSDRGPIIGTTSTRAQRNVIGTHSGSYSVYRALAVAAGALSREHRADLTNTAPTESIGPYPQWWEPGAIVSMDPWGAMIAEAFANDLASGMDIRPTIAVTKAHVSVPEIADAIARGRLVPDGRILLTNGAAVVTKVAVEPVWFLPGIAARFGCTETELRRVLFEETGGMFPELVTRPDLEVFLPPIGGQTVYIFGKAADLADPAVELTARVHDECNGSDVFGSDICTCRPYLTHAIEECIRGTQQGGAGVVAYSRKEGRALGEVTKFLVYNARKRQAGGDTADQYFARTECVAGVQDMRFQELMPDVLHWLGIRKIHRLVSMSNMKYDAITASGIEVGERVNIPDGLIPPDARVEMDAKMAAGYFTPGPVLGAEQLKQVRGRGLDETTDNPVGAAAALRSTAAIRDRANQLLHRARDGRSTWFTVDDDALDLASAEVAAITRERYPSLTIPYHSRWRHFEAGGVDRLSDLKNGLADASPKVRAAAMIDLAIVSVLLDAGAGPDWAFAEHASGQVFTRSEGLGVASWHAFVSGLFSSDPASPLQADADGLRRLTAPQLAEAFQVSSANPIVGLDGRVELLHRLGAAVSAATSAGRPSALFDDLTEPSAHDILTILLTALSGIWPSGNAISGEPLGDCWRHAAVAGPGLTDGWMPLHKLSQWMTYSLLEPFELAGLPVSGVAALTGLPEYRNGGLLLDTGLLRLRDPEYAAREWTVGDELVVEWRALTIALLDELAPMVRARLDVNPAQMPLACVLEGGTWAAGRALAQRLRGGLPPLSIVSDGSVF